MTPRKHNQHPPSNIIKQTNKNNKNQGTEDILLARKHFAAFFREFGAIDATLDVDALPPADIKGTIRDPSCAHCGK